MITIDSKDRYTETRAEHQDEIICFNNGDGTRLIWRPSSDEPVRQPADYAPRYTNKP